MVIATAYSPTVQPESVVARRLIDRLGEPGRHVVWDGAAIDDAYSSLAQCDASLAMRMPPALPWLVGFCPWLPAMVTFSKVA